MDILSCYDVELSHIIQSKLDDHQVVIRRDSMINVAVPLQELSIPCNLLEQEPTIILGLGKSVTLKILLCLIDDLTLFLEQILEQLDFLVYFHLHNCAMFRRHLMSQMAEVSTYSERTPKRTLALPVVSTQQSSCDANSKLLQVII